MDKEKQDSADLIVLYVQGLINISDEDLHKLVRVLHRPPKTVEEVLELKHIRNKV